MSFDAGWSPSNLLNLVEFGIVAYGCCKDPPPDAQGLQDKLRYLARQLNFPDDLLEQLGHNPYPHAKDLEHDLSKHNAFLERFKGQSGESEAAYSRRVEEIIKEAWREHRFKRIKKDVEKHLDKLRDFRQEAILKLMVSKFRRFIPGESENVRGKKPVREVVPLPNSPPLVTGLDIVSRAAIAYQTGESLKARYTQSVQTQRPAPGPRPDRKRPSWEDVLKFKENIVEITISSKSKLYLGNISPTELDSEHYEDIYSIAKALDDLTLTMTPPNASRSEHSTSVHSSPLSKAPDVWDQEHSSPNYHSTSATPPSSLMPIGSSPSVAGQAESSTAPNRYDYTHERMHDLSESTEPPPTRQPEQGEPSMQPLPPPHDNSSSSFHHQLVKRLSSQQLLSDPMTTSTEVVRPISISVDLEHVIYVSDPRGGNKPVPRRLTLSKTEGIVWLSAVAEVRAMTPDLLFRQRSRAAHAPDDDFQAVLIHILGPCLDSYPLIRYALIDNVTPMHQDAPYSVHFLGPQRQISSHDSEDEIRVRGFKYHLQSSKDRKVLRENIFGKTLLTDIGVDHIKVGGKIVCRKESISLWKEKPFDTIGHVPMVSIVVPHYPNDHPITPNRIHEYAICNCKNLIKRLRDAKGKHQGVRLDVEPLPFTKPDHTNGRVRRQESVSTNTTSSTTGSILSIFLGSSSAASDATYIDVKFSDTYPGCMEDKKEFLNSLIQHFSVSA